MPTKTDGAPRTQRVGGSVRRFLLGAGISAYGDWLTTVALVVVLFDATKSAAAPAGYMVVRVAPRPIGAGPGGALADRWGPARAAAGAMLAQAAAIAGVILSARSGELWAVYTLVAAGQLAGAMCRPALTALTRLVSTDATFARTSTLYGTVTASSLFVAPALGAPLLALHGPFPLLALDAFSFVAAAALLGTMPRPPTEVRVLDDGRTVGGRSRSLTLVLGSRPLRLLAAASFTGGVVVTALQAVLVVLAAERLGGPAEVASCYAAVGGGGLVATMAALRWPRDATIRPSAIVAAVEVEVLALAALVFAHARVVAWLLLAVSSAAATLYQVRAVVLMGRAAPPGQLGRVAGVISTAQFAGMATGAICALALTPVIGWVSLLVVLTVVTGVATFAVWALPTAPELRGERAETVSS